MRALNSLLAAGVPGAEQALSCCAGEAVHPADRPFPPSSNWGPPHHAHSAPGWPADDPYAPRGSRYHEADWDRARSRERSGELSRGGSEPDWDMQREVDWQRRSGDRDNPTASIFIKVCVKRQGSSLSISTCLLRQAPLAAGQTV